MIFQSSMSISKSTWSQLNQEMGNQVLLQLVEPASILTMPLITLPSRPVTTLMVCMSMLTLAINFDILIPFYEYFLKHLLFQVCYSSRLVLSLRR